MLLGRVVAGRVTEILSAWRSQENRKDRVCDTFLFLSGLGLLSYPKEPWMPQTFLDWVRPIAPQQPTTLVSPTLSEDHDAQRDSENYHTGSVREDAGSGLFALPPRDQGRLN